MGRKLEQLSWRHNPSRLASPSILRDAGVCKAAETRGKTEEDKYLRLNSLPLLTPENDQTNAYRLLAKPV